MLSRRLRVITPRSARFTALALFIAIVLRKLTPDLVVVVEGPRPRCSSSSTKPA
ncbi:MAG: hypothetical protein H7Y32_08550 [Chloroflexales bacterium]|nr:hypothetical protein [Chloroflexales bacterium]